MAPKDIETTTDAHESLRGRCEGDQNGPDALVVMRCTGGKAANKVFDVVDGKVIKQAAANAPHYRGLQIPVPDQAAMVEVLEIVGRDPQACLCVGRFVDAPVGPFDILSAKAIEKAGGTGAGWHQLYDGLAISRAKANMRPSSWLLFDRDFTDDQPEELTFHDTEEWWRAMCRIAPGLEGVGRIDLPSSSSRLIDDETGEAVFTSPSSHHYVQMKDPDDLPRFGAALLAQAMLRGVGFRRRWGDHARSWSIYDPTTLSWERVSFDGAPVSNVEGTHIGPPCVVIGAKGGRFDSRTVETPEGEERTTLARDHSLTITTRENKAGLRVSVLEDNDALALSSSVTVQLQGREVTHTLTDLWLKLAGMDPDTKLRAQSPFRPSDSWAALLRLDKSGSPFVYDVGPHVLFRLRNGDRAGLPVAVFLAEAQRLKDAIRDDGTGREKAFRFIQATAYALGRHEMEETDEEWTQLLNLAAGVLSGGKRDHRAKIKKWVKRASAQVRGREAVQSDGLPMLHDALHDMNQRHGVAMFGGKTAIVTERQDELGNWQMSLISPSDLRTYMANQYAIELTQDGPRRVEILPRWMSWPQRNTFDAVQFKPRASVREHGRTIQQGGIYNMWQGYLAEPFDPEGDQEVGDALETILDHFFQVWADDDLEKYKYQLDWIATAIQFPERTNLPVLVLKSIEGTGKGMVVDGLLMPIFGVHGMVVSRTEDLTGRFTGHLGLNVLLSMNEALWGGQKKETGAYKAVITDEMRGMELKYKDRIQVPNYTKVIMSSNEVWFAPLGLQDRRHVVFECSAKFVGDVEYFKRLRRAIEKARGAFLHMMLNREVDADEIRKPPKWKSEAAVTATFKSSDNVAAWLYSFLSSGQTFTDVHSSSGYYEVDAATGGLRTDANLNRVYVELSPNEPVRLPVAVIHAAYSKWVHDHRVHEKPSSNEAFWASVDALLGDAVSKPKTMRLGGASNPTRGRNFESLPKLRAAFQESVAQPLIWEETDDDA
ncbi:DUF5906 domain-containing protein [Ruegeria profundi]|uniref:DUF5906 domain-containing protein n=1 Tax=Ruegeria profundi TaxID=1685378 RepID=UPI001CD7494D|nr:DUF5906 domain-containing protein [Ruegeria profundi]MCA0927099.1 DUF5906 domain-containing protein [Ruegeria profundi]